MLGTDDHLQAHTVQSDHKTWEVTLRTEQNLQAAQWRHKPSNSILTKRNHTDKEHPQKAQAQFLGAANNATSDANALHN